MGTKNRDEKEYANYILDSDETWARLGDGLPDLGDITAIFIDNDTGFEEQAKAHRAEAREELMPDTGLPGCMALEPEEIQSAVAQGLQDGLTNAELLAAMAEIGTAARDAELKAFEHVPYRAEAQLGAPNVNEIVPIYDDAERQAFKDWHNRLEPYWCKAPSGTTGRDAETGEPDTQGGRTYGDPELQAYEDWLDRMEPFMKHGADCVATGYETINLGDLALTQPIEIRNLELELKGGPALTSVNIPYRWLPKRGRCGSRKRYVKLLMSLGVPRNFANRAAETMRENHISYQQNWEQYYTVNEMFGLRPTGTRGRGIYDRENDQYELFPAYSD